MEDFYQILGLDCTADSSQIRAAYKRLAKKYHPDRNPGDVHAEEAFKKINEAYHNLSDPFKKAQYDNHRNAWAETQEFWEEQARKERYYQWQRAQQQRYRFDKEYFKIQGLAFLVFIIISGFCFTVIHTLNYYVHKKNMERWLANSQSLKQVNALFIEGKVEDAFNMIRTLKQNDPLEFRFSFAHDSLVGELRIMADEKFNQKDFPSALIHYSALKNHEEPVRFETVRKIMLCQYYLGNFKESLQALKHLHNQRPGDLELVYQIGIINLEKLDNAQEALHYFTLGKKLFKENLTKVYGEAFEIVMDPADAPDIYYEVFHARARTNLLLNNLADAVTDCNWAIYLRPQKQEPYTMRAHASIRLKKFDNVCFDLQRAKKAGCTDCDLLLRRYCQ